MNTISNFVFVVLFIMNQSNNNSRLVSLVDAINIFNSSSVVVPQVAVDIIGIVISFPIEYYQTKFRTDNNNNFFNNKKNYIHIQLYDVSLENLYNCNSSKNDINTVETTTTAITRQQQQQQQQQHQITCTVSCRINKNDNFKIGDVIYFNQLSLRKQQQKQEPSYDSTINDNIQHTRKNYEFYHSIHNTTVITNEYYYYHLGTVSSTATTTTIDTKFIQSTNYIATGIKYQKLVEECCIVHSSYINQLVQSYCQSNFININNNNYNNASIIRQQQQLHVPTTLYPLPCQFRTLQELQSCTGTISNVIVTIKNVQYTSSNPNNQNIQQLKSATSLFASTSTSTNNNSKKRKLYNSSSLNNKRQYIYATICDLTNRKRKNTKDSFNSNTNTTIMTFWIDQYHPKCIQYYKILQQAVNNDPTSIYKQQKQQIYTVQMNYIQSIVSGYNNTGTNINEIIIVPTNNTSLTLVPVQQHAENDDENELGQTEQQSNCTGIEFGITQQHMHLNPIIVSNTTNTQVPCSTTRNSPTTTTTTTTTTPTKFSAYIIDILLKKVSLHDMMCKNIHNTNLDEFVSLFRSSNDDENDNVEENKKVVEYCTDVELVLAVIKTTNTSCTINCDDSKSLQQNEKQNQQQPKFELSKIPKTIEKRYIACSTILKKICCGLELYEWQTCNNNNKHFNTTSSINSTAKNANPTIAEVAVAVAVAVDAVDNNNNNDGIIDNKHDSSVPRKQKQHFLKSLVLKIIDSIFTEKIIFQFESITCYQESLLDQQQQQQQSSSAASTQDRTIPKLESIINISLETF